MWPCELFYFGARKAGIDLERFFTSWRGSQAPPFYARRFQGQTEPATLPAPEVTPEPDGEIALQDPAIQPGTIVAFMQRMAMAASAASAMPSWLKENRVCIKCHG